MQDSPFPLADASPRRTLAELEGLGKVQLCSCGTVHLRIGPVEVSLSREAFSQAVELVCAGMAELEVDRVRELRFAEPSPLPN